MTIKSKSQTLGIWKFAVRLNFGCWIQIHGRKSRMKKFWKVSKTRPLIEKVYCIRISYTNCIRISYTNCMQNCYTNCIRFIYEFYTNCIRITYELCTNLYEFQKVTIRINSYAAYRKSYQYRIMLRIPYTNLIRIFGDGPLDLKCKSQIHLNVK